jgi:peptidyl-dipeptidase Dcp
MKETILLMLFGTMLFTACSVQEQNPFFSEYQTPFGTPPFEKIKESHYLPAFTEGISQHQQEISSIVNNQESPTFQNTVEALENSGQLLTRVRAVFFNMISANTNERMQELAKEVSPMLSQNADDILLNENLFQRIKAVYDEKDQLDLTSEQQRLLEETYKRFARNGANLDEKEKAELREINKELSLLTLKFGDNVLKETNKFELMIDNEADLAGLPDNVISAAAETGKERGKEGAWVFTIQKPSMIPFLQYSQKRDLREKIFKAYINQGNHNDELDNKATLTRIAALRLQRANLLGYKTHADFVLEENMAKVPQNVYNRLNQIWKPALKVAQKEEKALQNLVYADGQNFKLEPWDWWYYAEKLKKQKYDLDDEVLRPYFKLENVREGAFMVANKLWGLTFEERTDIPTYNPDVKTFEVKDADGTHIGILYTD